jgi:putative intracellular protease/amidase
MTSLEIAIPLYDRFTALDAIGPYEVLSRLPGARVRFLAASAGPVVTDNGMLTLLAEAGLSEMPAPDVVVVPGGIGSRALLEDEQLLGWLRGVHAGSRFTTSVCTGSLLLAAAGLLDGVDATTHWLARDLLATLGARPVAERVVERGKIITAAGVSAGIDMALTLAARIAGAEVAQTIQLYIEYAPEPPFDSGSLERAPAEIVARAQEYAARDAGSRATGATRLGSPGRR